MGESGNTMRRAAGGSKGGSSSQDPTGAERMQGDIAKEMYTQRAGPLLDRLIPRWQSIVSGTYDLSNDPYFQLGQKESILQTGNMFNQQRDQILERTPVGGQQIAQLAGAAGNVGALRAGGQADLMQQIMDQYSGQVYGFASGAPQASVAGLTGPAQNQAAMQAMQAQQAAQLYSALGTGFGAYFGGAPGAAAGGQAGASKGSK